LKCSIFHRDLIEAFKFFNLWCEKIFSRLSFQHIEFILEKLPILLINDLGLSISDRQLLMREFFGYLFEFCKLQPQEFALLTDLKERLEERFFSSNKIVKLFKRVRAHCHFLKVLFLEIL
jgi:hypothetical protein